MLACVLFARTATTLFLLFIGVFLSSFRPLPPTRRCLRLAREHADRTGREAVINAQSSAPKVSLARSLPPLAYALAGVSALR